MASVLDGGPGLPLFQQTINLLGSKYTTVRLITLVALYVLYQFLVLSFFLPDRFMVFLIFLAVFVWRILRSQQPVQQREV